MTVRSPRIATRIEVEVRRVHKVFSGDITEQLDAIGEAALKIHSELDALRKFIQSDPANYDQDITLREALAWGFKLLAEELVDDELAEAFSEEYVFQVSVT